MASVMEIEDRLTEPDVSYSKRVDLMCQIDLMKMISFIKQVNSNLENVERFFYFNSDTRLKLFEMRTSLCSAVKDFIIAPTDEKKEAVVRHLNELKSYLVPNSTLNECGENINSTAQLISSVLDMIN